MPAHSSGSVRLSGRKVVSQSMPASAISMAAMPHHSSASGVSPKRQPIAAKTMPVNSSTSG